MNILILDISKEVDKLKMSAYEKHKSSSHRQYYESTISHSNIHDLCEEITDLFNKSNKQGTHVDDVVEDLRKKGQLLFDLLIINEIKQQISSSKAKFLIFSIDEQLVYIPWELLHDGQDFLSLRFAVGRSVRTKQRFSNTKTRCCGSSFKMLALCDPTGDLKAAYKEGIGIRDALDKKKTKLPVTLKTTEVEKDYVQRNLREYDIVHYAGHADYDMDNPSESGWKLLDGNFTAKDIANLGASVPFPLLVFSNACQSGKAQAWLIEKEYENRIYGLANAFLLAGVRHYIGTFWHVQDESCLLFAKHFYKLIAEGMSIGEAIKLSRIALIEKYGKHSIAWTSYVLYGDPSLGITPEVYSSKGPEKRSISFAKRLVLLFLVLLCLLGGVFLTLRYKQFYDPELNISIMRFDNLDTGESDVKLPHMIVDTFKSISSASIVDINLYTVDHSIKDVAKKFGVKRVISGQFSKDGDLYTLRLNAINPQNGKILNTREIAIEDSPGFAQELSLQILDMLKLGLSKKEKYELLRKPTDNAEAYRLFSQSWDMYLAEDYDKALRLCKKVLEIDPGYLQAFMRIGNIYDRMNQRDKALEAYHKYAELSEKKGDLYNLANAYANIGWILETQQKMDVACDYYEKGLKLCRDNNDLYTEAKIYDLLGYFYFKKGQLNEARSFINKSIEINEDRQYIYNHRFFLANNFNKMGMIYDKENQYSIAIDYFNKSLDIYKDLGDESSAQSVIERINAVYEKQKNNQDKGIVTTTKQPGYELAPYNKLKVPVGSDKESTLNHEAIFEEDKDILEAFELYNKALEYFNNQHYFEAIDACKRANQLSPNFVKPLQQLGYIYATLGEWDKALGYYNQCIKIADEKKDYLTHAFLLIDIGEIYDKKNQENESLKCYLKARDMAKKLDSAALLADAYHLIGLWYSYHKYAENTALEYLFKSELVMYEINDKDSLGGLYDDIAIIYAYLYDIDNAEIYSKKAFDLIKDSRDKRNLLSHYSKKSYLDSIKGEYDSSISSILKSLDIASQFDMGYEVASSQWYAGQLYEKKGEYVEALNQYNSSLEFYLSKEEKKMIAYVYEDTAGVCAKMDDFSKALKYTELAMSIYKELDDKLGMSNCYDAEGEVYFYMENYSNALASYNLALEMSKYDDLEKYEDYGIYKNIGVAYYKLGDYDKALEFCDIAFKYSETCKSRPCKASIYQCMGLVYEKKGLKKMAIEYLSKAKDLIYEMGIEKAREYREGLKKLEELQKTI